MPLKDSINNLDEEGFSLLHLNAKDGNAENVQKLINDGADIEIKDRENGSTPLLWACQNGHTNVVKILLRQGVNVKAASFVKKTALHFAAQSGQVDLVEILIKEGLKVDSKDKNGVTSLFQACYKGQRSTVECLIQNGADLSARLVKNNYTCLHIASEKGHVEVLKLLLENGVDLHSRNKSGDTPFLRNCFLGYAKAAKFLLENGANIRDVNNNLLSGLHLIALKDKNVYETTKLLLENGADVTLKANIFYDEMMPFQLAVMRPVPKPNIPFIKALFDFNPTYNIRDGNNDNAVDLVLRKKVHDAMKIVLFSFHQ